MELTRRLTQLVILRLDELTDELVLEILQENAGYVDASHAAAELVPLDELHRSCRDNLERVLQLLGDMVPPGVDPVDAAMSTGTRRAERRAPLEAVLRLRRLDEHRRLTMFTDLLRGRGRDAAFAAEAAAELDLPADADFLVLAADLRQDSSAEDLLAVHGVRSIWQPHARHTVGLVALDRHDADRVLDLLRTAVRDRVGVSPRVHGLGEVGTAHELAVLALRTLPAGTSTTARLDDRLPAALLVRSPDLVDRLVEVVLGPLLRLPDGERQQLLATLSAWLRSNRSPAAAAERLYCHRNTVINRMSKVESLLGRSLEDFENALTVSYALLALDLPEGSHAQHK